MNRICVYTKDIQQITGKSDKTCRSIMNKIRKHLNKEKYQSITIAEFCNYQGLDIQEVKKLIK